jgi:hypothetical protein
MLNELIKENLEMLAQPVVAFVTFTTREAKERCRQYLFESRLKMGGVSLEI